MGILVFMYMICSVRTNVVFFLIFLLLDIALFLLTGAYWKAAEGNAEAFGSLSVVSSLLHLYRIIQSDQHDQASGALVFAFCMLGFYLLFAQLLQAVEFPLDLPVGDLSTRFKRKSAYTNSQSADMESGA
jgi:uncharacterized protein